MSIAPTFAYPDSSSDALERAEHVLGPFLRRSDDWAYFIREPGATMATFSMLLPWPTEPGEGATPFQRAALERVQRVFEGLGFCEELEVGIDTGWLREVDEGPERRLRVCGTMVMRV